MRKFFPAVVEKEEQSHFGVFFPDFPGCVTAGDTPEEALELAAEALAGHVALMVEDGDEIPAPTLLEKLGPFEDLRVVCVSLVPVSLPGKAVRVNITLDEGLVDDIDAVCRNRSRFLADAARVELARRRAVA